MNSGTSRTPLWLLVPLAAACAALLWWRNSTALARQDGATPERFLLPMAEKSCCEKPPNRAELLQQSVVPIPSLQAEPASPAPARPEPAAATP